MSAWRQTRDEASDSEDDVVFMGPVTDRELEISRLLNETVCLPDPDASDSANDTLAGLEGGLRSIALEGARESCTMHELELPTAAPGAHSYPLTSSRLDESAAPLASSENTSLRQWEDLPSEHPLSSTRLTEESRQCEQLPSGDPLSPPPAEESRVWEELPSECPLADPAAVAEESRVWEELPSECPLADPAAVAEESRVWEELPSEYPLSAPPPAEESQQWEELPSEYPLSVPPPAEESQQWEEMPSEYPLSVPPPAEESQQWEEMPSEYPLSVPALAQDSICEDEEEKDGEPAADGSHWLTMPSDAEDDVPGDSLDERRETPGALLGALCDELAEPASTRASSAGVSPRVALPVSPRSPSSGGGLLQAMHRQLSSPGAVSVAASSVGSYHTCYGGGGTADDSRRLTGASALSDISLAPNSTLGAETAVDSEDDSRLYESGVEEQQEQRSVADAEDSHASAAPGGRGPAAVDDTTSDNCSRPPSLAGRDRTVSLASECSLAGSYVSGTSTGSELNDTLEMMDRLLAMEAEERHLESILQSRTAASETVLQGSRAAPADGDSGETGASHSRVATGNSAPARAPPAVVVSAPAVTPRRPAPTGTAGRKTTPVPLTTPRGRGRLAALTPRQQQRTLAAPSPARLATPRGRMAPSPARSATSAAASRLKTPTLAAKTATVASQSTTPRTKPNLKDIVSPVARYIHDGPEPTLVQNLRPKNRMVNSVVPQARPTPQKLAPLAEEAASPPSQPSQEAGKVLRELNASSASTASNTSNVSAGSGASTGSRIPVKVPSHGAGGQENMKPQSLPKVSYKSSGNLVMEKTAWNKMVRTNTAENRKVGRFVPSPSPVLAVKHTGHMSVSSRRVRWNDEFAVPDMAVRVRPMRRSFSDCDLTQSSDASFMEVSVCEVRSARPAVIRH